MSTQPTQPEALRLADELERDKWYVPAVVMQAAADELRRLHAENAQLREQNTALDAACAKLEAVRGTPATGGEPVYAFRRKGLDDFCTCDKERYEELSDKPNLFETCILYTSPQPVREPLTPGQVNGLLESAGYWSGDTARADFINGIRYAEATHGIKEKA